MKLYRLEKVSRPGKIRLKKRGRSESRKNRQPQMLLHCIRRKVRQEGARRQDQVVDNREDDLKSRHGCAESV